MQEKTETDRENCRDENEGKVRTLTGKLLELSTSNMTKVGISPWQVPSIY